MKENWSPKMIETTLGKRLDIKKGNYQEIDAYKR